MLGSHETLLIAVKGDATDYIKGVDKAKKASKGFGAGLKKLGKTIAKSATVAVLALTTALVGLFKGFVKAGKELENYRVILQQLYGDAKKANDVLGYMMELQIKTPYNPKDLMNAAVGLEKFGVDAREFVSVIGDASAAMGYSGDDMAANAMAFGRAMKIGSAGMRQLRMRFGVDMTDLVKISGHSADELSSNQALFQEALVGFFKQERFVGGMDRLAKTFTGVLSSIGGIWTDFQMQVGKQINDLMKGAFGKLLDWLLELSASGQLTEWANRMAAAFQVFWDALGGGEGIQEFLSTVMEVVIQLSELLGGVLGTALRVIMELLGELLPVVMELVDPILSFISDLLPYVKEILQKLLPPLMKILMPLIEMLLPMLLSILDVLMPFIELFAILLEPIAPLLQLITLPLQIVAELLKPLSGWLSKLGEKIFPVVSDAMGKLTGIIEGLVGWLRDAIGWIVKLFQTPEQQAAAARRRASKAGGILGKAVAGQSTMLGPFQPEGITEDGLTSPADDTGGGGGKGGESKKAYLSQGVIGNLALFDAYAGLADERMGELGIAIEELEEKIDSLIEKQGAWLRLTVDGLKAFAGSFKDALGGLIDSFFEPLKFQLDDSMSAFGKFWRSVVNGLVDMIAKVFIQGLALVGIGWLLNALFPGAGTLLFKLLGADTGLLGFKNTQGKAGGVIDKLSGAIEGRAGGGDVRSGQPYWVGEREPELFVPNQSGQIFNSEGIMNALSNLQPATAPAGAMGAKEIHVHLDGGLDQFVKGIRTAPAQTQRQFGEVLGDSLDLEEYR